MKIVNGKVTARKTVKTKAGRDAIVFTLKTERWNKETKTTEDKEETVWYFCPESGSAIAFEKAKTADYGDKQVLFSVSDLGTEGAKVSRDAPRLYGICSIPASVKENVGDEDVMATDEAIANCVAAGELPEGYAVDVGDINSILDTSALLSGIKTETAKAAMTALYRIYNEAEYAYIGVAASVKKNDKGNGVVSFALPVKPGDETKWGTCTFFGKSADIPTKVLRAKERCILFMVGKREVEGRTFFTGRKIIRL